MAEVEAEARQRKVVTITQTIESLKCDIKIREEEVEELTLKVEVYEDYLRRLG